jgi:hypothetical protein
MLSVRFCPVSAGLNIIEDKLKKGKARITKRRRNKYSRFCLESKPVFIV